MSEIWLTLSWSKNKNSHTKKSLKLQKERKKNPKIDQSYEKIFFWILSLTNKISNSKLYWMVNSKQEN